jgi:hypothetical protein
LQQGGDDEEVLRVLWAPTFGYWERLACFYRAPVTLFWMNAIYRLLVAVLSGYYLAHLQSLTFQTTHEGDRAEDKADAYNAVTDFASASNATAVYPIDIELREWSETDSMQMVLACHYMASLLIQVLLIDILIMTYMSHVSYSTYMMQVVHNYLVGFKELTRNIWAWLDMMSSILFIIAFVIKHYSGNVWVFYMIVREAVIGQEDYNVCCDLGTPFQRAGLFFLLQGISGALQALRFVRVLSVSRKFGKFVLTYLSMFSAIKHGFVVGLIMWVAFTMSRIGLTLLCQTYPEYLLMSGTE